MVFICWKLLITSKNQDTCSVLMVFFDVVVMKSGDCCKSLGLDIAGDLRNDTRILNNKKPCVVGLFKVGILLMEEIRLTSWYSKYPIIYVVLDIPGGAGFLPSTVVQGVALLNIQCQKFKRLLVWFELIRLISTWFWPPGMRTVHAYILYILKSSSNKKRWLVVSEREPYYPVDWQ